MFVQIRVAGDGYFKRDGADVHVTVPLGVAQAVLGSQLTVRTLTGEADVKVPAGSQPRGKLVMRGKGIKKLNSGGYGNMYVHLDVKIPRTLTTRQRELMQQFLAEEEGGAGASTKASASGDGEGEEDASVGEAAEEGEDSGFFSETFGRLKAAMGETSSSGERSQASSGKRKQKKRKSSA
jgi:hypothetical protein